jgi:DNA-binding transcriptional LysR family regulator
VQLDVEPRLKIVVPSMLRRALNGELEGPLGTGRIVPERLMEFDGLACTLEFVADTDWVALLPASVIGNDPKASRVRFSPIAGDEVMFDYFVMHASTAPLSAAAQAFVDLAVAELTRLTMQGESRMSARSRRHRGPQGVGMKVARIGWKSSAAAPSVA